MLAITAFAGKHWKNDQLVFYVTHCLPAPMPVELRHVLEKAKWLNSPLGRNVLDELQWAFFPNVSLAPPQVESFTSWGE